MTIIDPIVLSAQGSFAAGGTTRCQPGDFDPLNPADPAGQRFSGDHAHVFYQIPADARRLPLVMWHGGFQFSRCWGTTADGREGFQTLFLRRRFSTYVLEQPRRGNAGRSMEPGQIAPVPDEQFWFNQFRLGLWPDYYKGVQFDQGPATLDQFVRAFTPNTGPFDLEVVTAAVSALFDRIGPAVLMTHSQSGGPGWLTALRNRAVHGIVSFEPGSNFVFPAGQAPLPMASSSGPVETLEVPLDQFMALTRIPIVIYYGDNIPAAPTPVPNPDSWRVRLAMARIWADTVNRHGGMAEVVHLPQRGIRGNTHSPFSDLNNLDIAEQVLGFLAAHGLNA